MRNFFYLLILFTAFAGCKKGQTARGPKLDACGLLTKEEIGAVQGTAIMESKSSEHSEAGLRVSQCYFGATEASKSVSLSVTQADTDQSIKRTPKDYWQDTFGHRPAKKESDGGKEEEERERAAPTKIEGVGDDAYWEGNRVGGALYAIKGDTFIRISLGGSDDEKTRIDKSKTLAKKTLDRF
ncbi:MAG: hypothetical protein ABI925_07880 [Verrucomicrobiota bacterium]